MAIKRISFGEWTPDQGDFQLQGEGGTTGLYKMGGLVDYAGNLVGCPGLHRENLTGGSAPYLASEIFGFHLHTDSALTPGAVADLYAYVGTNDRILRSTVVGGITTQNATAGALANSPDTTSGWQFTSFANTIAATQFGDTTAAFGVPMQWAAAPGTNFTTLNSVATPTTYDPIARYITAFKNHLLIGHVAFQATLGPFSASTVYPNLVMWSATDNDQGAVTTAGIHRWGDEEFVNYEETIGSGWQMLSDNYGPVTAVSASGDYAYCFKPKAIYRMDGPPWTFHPIVVGSGTIWPNSVVHYGNDTYFWGSSGPSLLRFGSSEVESLGLGKTARTVTDLQNSELFPFVFEVDTFSFPAASGVPAFNGVTRPIDITAVVDYRAGLVAWFSHCQLEDGQNFVHDTGCLVYDISTKRFSFFQVPDLFMFAKASPRYSQNPMRSAGLNSDAMTQSPVLDGVAGVHLENDSGSSGAAGIGVFVGDVLGYTRAQPTAEFPTITLPFLPMEESDRTPVVSCVTGVKLPFKMSRFGEKVGDNDTWTASITIILSTKDAMDSTNVDTRSVTYTLPNVSPDDWLAIDGVEGLYHQLAFRIQTAPVTTNDYIRPTSHLFDLRYIDVAYFTSGSTGGTKPA